MTIPMDPLEMRSGTDLEQAVFESILCDTHEHQVYESVWTSEPSDVLSDLIGNYVPADLMVAGADETAIAKAMDPQSGDLEKRLEGVLPALRRSRFTGYGEAVHLLAEHIYGMTSITLDSLEKAEPILKSLKKPGGRLGLLQDVARLDHVQTDDFCWRCLPDDSGEDFFFYDLSWADMAAGNPDLPRLEQETGISISRLSDLEEAFEVLFEKYAPCAVAVKSQHAYSRTLNWCERDRNEAERSFERFLQVSGGESFPEEDRLCLGDWCWARGIELSVRHEIPFKIHTGYYAGNRNMPVNRIAAGNLCSLLIRYPEARFVLMHIAYPYQDELVAIAKHFPNVAVDLCWAWAIDPFSTKDFLRRMLHAVPVDRLFAFGGDTRTPTSAVAYSVQARKWIAKSLAEEVEDGFLTESQAIDVAEAWMWKNQYSFFEIEKKREILHHWKGPRLNK